MPEQESWHLDKRIPIALIVALFAQAIFGVWWVSGLNSQVQIHEKRIEKIETVNEKQVEIMAKISDRLARIEQNLIDLNTHLSK